MILLAPTEDGHKAMRLGKIMCCFLQNFPTTQKNPKQRDSFVIFFFCGGRKGRFPKTKRGDMSKLEDISRDLEAAIRQWRDSGVVTLRPDSPKPTNKTLERFHTLACALMMGGDVFKPLGELEHYLREELLQQYKDDEVMVLYCPDADNVWNLLNAFCSFNKSTPGEMKNFPEVLAKLYDLIVFWVQALALVHGPRERWRQVLTTRLLLERRTEGAYWCRIAEFQYKPTLGHVFFPKAEAPYVTFTEEAGGSRSIEIGGHERIGRTARWQRAFPPEALVFDEAFKSE